MSLKKTHILPAALLALLFAGCSGHEASQKAQTVPATDTVVVSGIVPVRVVEGAGNGGYLSIPEGAVFHEGAMAGVFVVGPNDRLETRWISVGHAVDGRVIVLAGLSEGELVVGSCDPALHEGVAVTKRQAVTEEDQSK
ncbi:MAG: hypothetical protein RAO75_05465 [Candidatus Chlorobium antarcticum]|jgi:hypothetical protein|nr:hypothetical protein [Candidatus Chlorobium antarcticum]